jgi:tripartite-type tricarboxylate transporter receptor subunit TctC
MIHAMKRRAAMRGAAFGTVWGAASGAVLAAMLACCAPAAAQGFPERAVKVIVPVPPGGSSDVVARVLADGATQALGQTVLIDNIAGAGGNVGTARAARAAPDGYTLTQCTIGTCAINPSLYGGNPGYDLFKDFVPVFFSGGVMNIFTVNNSVPVKNIAELVALAKAQPGKVTFASSGVGSSNHLTPEWLKFVAGIDMVHVPYKGSGPAITDLIGGQVMMFVDNEPSILPQIKGGKVRALAVTGAQRSGSLPEVPTMEEAGYKGFVVEPWFGFIAPRGTPKAAIDKLNAAFNAALANPRVKARLEEAGMHGGGGPPERLGEQMKGEYERWAKVIKANNIKAE